MTLGRRVGATGWQGAAGKDLRQPLLRHLCEASGGVLSDETAAGAFLDNLRRAAANQDHAEMERLIRTTLGEVDDAAEDALSTVLRRVMQMSDSNSSIAWLPLEAMIKITGEAGVVRGFKGTTELDNWFQRWRAWRKAEGATGADLAPEAFVAYLRRHNGMKAHPRFPGAQTFDDDIAAAAYERWIRAQIKRNEGSLRELTLDDFLAYPPSKYRLNAAPGKRPALAMESMFGPTPARRTGAEAIRRAPGPDKSDWGKKFPRQMKEGGPSWKSDLINLLIDSDAFEAAMLAAFNRRFPEVANIPKPHRLDDVPWDARAPIWMRDVLIHHIFEAGTDAADGLGDNIMLDTWLRTNLTGSDGDAILTAMLGRKIMDPNTTPKLSPEEFVERLLDNYEAFGAVALNMNIPWESGKFRRLGGMFELVQKGMSRSGTVRGYVFELESLFVALSRASDDADLVLQFKIGGLDGPDLMIIAGDSVSVTQMKAYLSVSSLYGWGGEAARQTGSDISRMIDEFGGDLDALVARPGHLDLQVDLGPKGQKKLSNEWTFFVDGRRNAEGLSTRVLDNMARETAEMNTMLARQSDRIADNAADFDAFCDAATHRIAKDGPTINETLRRAHDLDLDPGLETLGELAALRLFLNEKTGLLTDDELHKLIKKAKVANKFNPPLTLKLEARTQQHLADGSFASTFDGLQHGG